MVGLEAENNAVIRYTTDGTDPSVESEEYKGKIKITDDTNLKARAFWNNGIQSAVVSHTYTNYSGNIVESADIKVFKPGLKFELYKGLWRELPDFDNLKIYKSGTAEFFDLACTIMENEFALSFTGYIKLPETDVYTFTIDSDDGTNLFIADRKLADNDGVHGMREMSGEIALEAGMHKIKLMYFQGRGGLGLNVYYQASGISKTIMPAEILYH